MLMLYFCNLVVPSDKGDYTRNEEIRKWFGTWVVKNIPRFS